MRKLLALAVTAIFGLALGACQGDSSLTSPQASADAQQNGPVTMTRSLADLGGLADVDGTVRLSRRVKNNTFNWNLRASGMDPGHAYTVWIGNFTESSHDGGWGTGGLVGGSGKINASGNHCLWELVTFSDGGFRPGKKASCDLVDVEGPVTFFLLDHGDWEPGDVFERWDPTGGTPDPDTPDPGTLEGAMTASFPEL